MELVQAYVPPFPLSLVRSPSGSWGRRERELWGDEGWGKGNHEKGVSESVTYIKEK